MSQQLPPSETKHTPLSYSPHSLSIWSEGMRILDDAGHPSLTMDERRAFVRRIVCAVNSHEKLVEALRDIACRAKRIRDAKETVGPESFFIESIAREALRAAGEDV